MIAESLKRLTVPIDSLRPLPDNPRHHPQRSLDSIRASLEEFGQRKPIVVRNGEVIAGNGTLAAAISLGWKSIAVAVADDLTEEQATAFAIADNRSSEHSEWDFEILAESLRRLKEANFDLDVTGWADYEVEPLLQAEWSTPEKEPLPEKDPEHVHITLTNAQKEVVDKAVDAYRLTTNEKATIGEVITAILGEYVGE